MKHKTIFYILNILIFAATLGSCSKHADEPGPKAPAHRTVLVYMVADNSLGSNGCDASDLAEMRMAADRGDLQGGRLLVYHNRRGTATGKPPVLVEIKRNAVDTLMVYPDNPEVYSVDADRMRRVFDDMRQFAQAASYGLILWSHGTGWSQGSRGGQTGALMSFGDDRRQTMSIPSLRVALTGQGFDWVYFDCCLMATVEVAYELRRCTPLIVGSGTELPLDGMPYDVNLRHFFRPEGGADLHQAARGTFESYNTLSGQWRTCAISVINTQTLDVLAQATRQVMQQAFTDFSLDAAALQRYDRPSVKVCTLYDMADYIDALLANPTLEPTVRHSLLGRWHEAYDECVELALATPRIFDEFSLDRYSGLGTFVITSPEMTSYKGYDNQSWYRDVVSISPILNK